MRRSEIEILVRDATSNEKWGPSGTQMSQIAMATHNYNDFNIIMNTLWERLNDDGKNWRHIYKVREPHDFLSSNILHHPSSSPLPIPHLSPSFCFVHKIILLWIHFSDVLNIDL
jgi:hypothetical protein